MKPAGDVCHICRNHRHVKTAAGWRRCECVKHALVLPTIRHGEHRYPDAYDREPPLALADVAIVGDYTAFRHRVWRSVLAYGDLLYEYLDAYRLVEIHFERDTQYQSVRELAAFDLLVISLGVAELPNKFLGGVTCQILTLRQHAGVPTWVYSPLTLSAVRVTYSPELGSMLQAMAALGSAAAALTAAPPLVRPNLV